MNNEKKTEQERILKRRFDSARLVHGEAIAGHLRIFLMASVSEKIMDKVVPRRLDISIGTAIIDDFLENLDTSDWESKKARSKKLETEAKRQKNLNTQAVQRDKAVRASMSKKKKKRGRLLGE